MILRICTTALALSLATAASAATTITINPITATWTVVSPQVPGQISYTGNGTANASMNYGSAPGSGYDFNAALTPFSVGFVPNGISSAFTLGDFSHRNFPNTAGSIGGALLAVTYGVALGSNAIGNFTSTFAFTQTDTPNNSNPCPFGGANGQGANINGCADRVQISLNSGSTQSFTIDNVQYVLNISGFQLGGMPTDTFLTAESATSTASLSATVAARDLVGVVPEPATWAMMIIGFGVVGGAIRRRTKAATALTAA